MTETTQPNVASDLQTSPIFRIRGQKSRWRYPDQRLTPENCILLDNINLSPHGSADSRYGFVRYNSTQLTGTEAVIGLIEHTYSTGTYRIVVTPTKVYLDDGTTRTNVTGSVTLSGTANNLIRHAVMRDQVIMTDGVSATFVKDNGGTGTNATALTGMPWTTCVDLIAHKGVLVALAPTESGIKQRTRLRWCDINTRTFVPDITVWRADNRYEVYEGGAAILGGVDNFGKLVVFKEDGVYFGQITYNTGFIEYRQDELVLRGFHPVARNSFLARPEFVWGIAKEGPFVIRPDMSIDIIGRDITDFWAGLNLSRLQYAQSMVNETNHQVRTLLSTAGATSGFDVIMVWDWETGDFFFEYPYAALNYIAPISIGSVEYELQGTLVGYLNKANTEAYDDDNGVGIDWEIQMSPNDLGSPGVTKTIVDFITLFYDRDGQSTVSLSIKRDQGQMQTMYKTLDFTNTLIWDAGNIFWDSGKRWLGGVVRQSRFQVNRDCHNVAPTWTGGTPASVLGYQVTYLVRE